MKIRETLELVRAWIIAEIEYVIECGEEGSDGYRSSCPAEREWAEQLFNDLVEKLESEDKEE